ncbi:hypothetical protein ACJU26_03805 [Acidithiobacillus sp. M4-SHS-6]|uniref:DnaJ-like cysteine-rich domain-containing protein n=1 Tax=Acidithiobacillus sp. M4-SHS-6 TaxID=3383024 RepID=UPI0039BDDDE0
MRWKSKEWKLFDLKPFCARNDPREYLNAPWREEGKVIASDGRIIIIVDDLPGDFPAPAAQVTGALRRFAGQFADKVSDPVWYGIADLPVPPNEPCPSCDGKGYRARNRSVCPDCDGEGTFVHGSHEYECQECDGTGFVDRHGLDGTATTDECPACDGSGIRFEVFPFPVGGVKFQIKYLNLLRMLPECELAVPEISVFQDVPASFRFSGGTGYLMPVNEIQEIK